MSPAFPVNYRDTVNIHHLFICISSVSVRAVGNLVREGGERAINVDDSREGCGGCGIINPPGRKTLEQTGRVLISVICFFWDKIVSLWARMCIELIATPVPRTAALQINKDKPNDLQC